MLQNLAALAVCAYGVYMFVTGQNGDGLSVQELIKSAVATLGGGGYLVYTNASVVTNYAKSLFPGSTTQKTVIKNSDFIPLEYEQKDFECLVFLRNRCAKANSEEGLKLCADLNRVMFSLYAETKEEVK